MIAAQRRYVAVVLAVLTWFSLSIAGFAYRFDALTTPAHLAGLQSAERDNIILPADLRYNAAFKRARIAELAPDIIVISSSRAGTLRDWMFRPYRFYNAAFTAWTTRQLLDVFEHLTREVRPRAVIVVLDYFMFTDAWEEAYGAQRTMVYSSSRYVSFKLARLIRALPSPSAFREQRRPDGFRADGSYLYPQDFIDTAREKFQTAARLIESSPGAPQMSERQKEPIARLAALARERNVRLIAVQLPYVRAAVDYLDHDEAYWTYSGVWREFESRQTADWLRGLGIPFVDLARSEISDSSLNFIDAFHPSEDGMVRVRDVLARQPDVQAVLPELQPAQ
ncbi:hydrolase [Bradyrhizobium sp. 83002]|uniref:hydrolase n=1 Tax=Bradyrhizobium aeschynomenes TaxID=2734909 RepID=UPI0015561577|nr:hydrolase [Bradyrhizobium aeschynomenes]NPU15077.1 hydrolase [Bradyrhizobium aeschynomenes]